MTPTVIVNGTGTYIKVFYGTWGSCNTSVHYSSLSSGDRGSIIVPLHSFKNCCIHYAWSVRSIYLYVPWDLTISGIINTNINCVVIHFGLAIRHRLFWIFPTICLCGIGEVIGWSGRLWSSYNPLKSTPFQIQITCTIIAPTPFLAANFIIFGRLIRSLGFKYSRIGPKWCKFILALMCNTMVIIHGQTPLFSVRLMSYPWSSKRLGVV